MISIAEFLSKNWFSLLQTIGIISSLAFAGINYRRELRSRRVTNFMELTKLHRDLWKLPAENPTLLRLFEIKKERMTEQFTEDDRRFLTMMVVHMHCYYEMKRNNQVIKLKGIEADYKEIFAAPMARRFWEESRPYQNDDFIKFIDRIAGPPKLDLP